MADKPLCSIPGCDKPICNGRGWCTAHYNRWYRHGDPLGGGPVKTEAGTLVAFIKQVALTWASDACLTWPFTGNNRGYGQVRYEGRRRIASHVICELAHGPAPEGFECAHSCGNGHLGCVNPLHLSWKTRQGNTDDRASHGRTVRGEQSPNAVLTEEQVREIRRLRAEGHSLRRLAAQFDVSTTLVRLIALRKAWGWLP